MAKEKLDYSEYITVDPMVCHGEPCLRGTRMPVSVVLDNLAAGVPVAEMTESYPSISATDIKVVLAYAADLARERIIPFPAANQ